MISFRHIPMLLAAAGLCLLAVGGVSCGEGRGSVARAEPAPDTVALVEGLNHFERGEYDLARERLLVSALSGSTWIRAESYLYLNALEMELANYDAARPWLERYHLETVRLLRSQADEARRVAAQTARLRRRQDIILGGVLTVAVLAVGGALFFVRRASSRRSVGAVGPVGVAGSGGVAESRDGSVEGNDPRAQPPSLPLPEWKGWLLDAEIFRRTAVWDEVAALAAQPAGRGARVMSTSRMEVLDGELAVRFADMAARLRAGWPSLTAGDVKLCCLSLLPLTPFARALCFGSTETNIIKQRKHTIKKKLSTPPLGPALFDFIFTPRTTSA